MTSLVSLEEDPVLTEFDAAKQEWNDLNNAAVLAEPGSCRWRRAGINDVAGKIRLDTKG